MGAYEEYWYDYRKLRGTFLKREQERLRRSKPRALGAQTVMVQKNLFSKLKRLYHDIAGVDDWPSLIDTTLEYGELVDKAREQFGAVFPTKIRELQKAREEEFQAEQKKLIRDEIDKIILDVTYDSLVEIYDLKPEEILDYQARHPYIAVGEIKKVLDALIAAYGKKLVDEVVEESAPVPVIEVKRPVIPAPPPPEVSIKVVTLPDHILRAITQAPGRDLRYYEKLLRDIEDRKYDGLTGEQISLAIDTIRPVIEELRKEEIEKAKRRPPTKPAVPEVEMPYIRRPSEEVLPERVPPTIRIPPVVEVEVRPVKLVDEVAVGRELEVLAKEKYGIEFRWLTGEQKVELYPLALERVRKAEKLIPRLPEIEAKLIRLCDKYGSLVFPQERLYWTLSKEDWEKIYPWTESLPMKIYRAFEEGRLDYRDFEDIGIPRWQVDEWLMLARSELMKRGLASFF